MAVELNRLAGKGFTITNEAVEEELRRRAELVNTYQRGEYPVHKTLTIRMSSELAMDLKIKAHQLRVSVNQLMVMAAEMVVRDVSKQDLIDQGQNQETPIDRTPPSTVPFPQRVQA